MAHVVLPLDGSDLARRAVPFAAYLAKVLGCDIRLVEAVVPPPVADDAPMPVDDLEAGALSSLEAEAKAISSAYGLNVDSVARFHMPAALILEEAASDNASYVVMTTHGRTGLLRAVAGSVAEQVLREAQLPVFLLPAAAPKADTPTIKHILIPLDGSELSDSVVQPVAALARRLHATITLVRVYPEPNEPVVTAGERNTPFLGSEAVGPTGDDVPAEKRVVATLDQQLNEIAQQARQYLEPVASNLRVQGVNAQTIQAIGDPEHLIVSEAERLGVDLIALSTHGRSGLDRLRHGSITEAVLRHSHVPLLTFGREMLKRIPMSPPEESA